MASVVAALSLHVGGQLVRLAEEAAASAMLRPLALVVSHGLRLMSSLIRRRDRRLGAEHGSFQGRRWRGVGLKSEYHPSMARRTDLTKAEAERRRSAAQRMLGLFSDVAPDRSLADELIADRRAEAAAESGESAVCRHRGGYDLGHD